MNSSWWFLARQNVRDNSHVSIRSGREASTEFATCLDVIYKVIREENTLSQWSSTFLRL